MSSSTDQTDSSCGFVDNLDILRELPFFTGVSLDVIKVLAYLSVTESFKPGDTLLDQGGTVDRSLYVLCGGVEILRTVEDGNEMSIMKKGEGFFMGGMGLLSPVHSLYTVRALDDVECLALSREKFVKTATRFPETLPKVLASVVQHVFKWEEKILTTRGEKYAEQDAAGLGLSLF